VREWVIDLPWVDTVPSHALLREWLANHARHLQCADDFAATLAEEIPADLAAHFAVFGVVRGLAFGEVDGLVDGLTGDVVPLDSHPVPASVPGVTRALQLRRDGGELLAGRLDPHLGLVGMRLAGGDAFVARVRGR
jgi:hypothetical protein